MTATTGVGGLIYGRALVDQKTGKKINFDELGGGNIPEDITDLIASKAPLDSPIFTGNPQAPTPLDDAIGKEIANVEYVKGLIAKLADSAPETLDTLNELAKALGDDPNFATTITNALAGKQPLSEILTSLSGLITAGNKLAYFSDKNVMALANLSAVGRVIIGQDSKTGVLDYLGIKTAATKGVQNDIYDATDGVVSLPGAFGFGAFIPAEKEVVFQEKNGPEEWVSWLRSAQPGRYLVHQDLSSGDTRIIEGITFKGMVEVLSPYPAENAEQAAKNSKHAYFYGINGELYYYRLLTSFADGDWVNIKGQFSYLQSTVGNTWGSPDVGGVMLGVYLGASNTDSNRKLVRGQTIPGSRIGCITLYSKVSTTGAFQSTPVSVTHSTETQRGTFIALSGSPSNKNGTDTGYIGLFMRIA
ncbi:tail fiber protein [Escherichia phage 18-1-2]|uniref:hypothetical protein n=2 Tax=Escherichia coli TaxID=562 RepID=UPI000CFC29D2|nr:hypothetical protein [Escherichia coli]UDW09823.1 tail fiber protein [Escherichia phage 18-1-2]UJQ87223.1 tail fiber protein [Escherichia phage 24-2-1]UJQ87490.1 tail fiber protein [Escherichia phage 19-1-2]UOX40088.1 tail fiber protein [Escherichia phage vB_EcoM_TH18]